MSSTQTWGRGAEDKPCLQHPLSCAGSSCLPGLDSDPFLINTKRFAVVSLSGYIFNPGEHVRCFY